MIELERKYSDEELVKFSDEEKVNIATLALAANEIDYGIKVLKNIKDENLVLQILENSTIDLRRKTDIFIRTSSDELKLKLIKNRHESPLGRYAIVVAEYIKDDDIKILSVAEFSNVFEKAEIISTLSSDLKKKEMISIEDFSLEASKSTIIRSINDLKIKIDLINRLQSRSERDKLVRELDLKNDEERLLVIEYLDASIIEKYKRILELDDKQKALPFLVKAFPEYSEGLIKSTFLSDSIDEKLAYIKSLKDRDKQQLLLSSIKIDSDELREKIINAVDNEYIIAIQLIGIENEEIREKYIDRVNDYTYKIELINSLLDARLRLKHIEEVKDKTKQQKMIETLNDDSAKLECLSNIKDENTKCRILMTVKDDKKKKKALDSIEVTDELNLAIVAASFKDDKYKQEYLERIKDRKNRTLVEIEYRKRDNLTNILLASNRKYRKIGIDKKLTIGIEVEAEGSISKQLLLKKKVLGNWNVKTESSLDDGVEITSPILKDRQEDVENIYIICEALARCNEYASESCGGHIHIGSDYLKSKEAYMNLFDIWGNAERLIYKISNQKGEIPRYGIPEYAAPISSKLNEALEKETINLADEESLDNFVSQVINAEESRFTGLNLLNAINGKKTIEFRIPNGTINPDTWIENIMLFGRMIEVSEKLAEIEKKKSFEQTPREKEQLRLRNALKEEIDEKDKLDILLDMLFDEEEQEKKKVYVDRYIVANEIMENMPLEKDPFRETEFSGVDFKKKKKEKHDKEEFDELIREMYIQSINDAIRMIRDEIITPDRDIED